MKGTTNGSKFKEINGILYKDVLNFDDTTKTESDAPVDPIIKVCVELSKFLLHKNKNYGDSAREPLRIFSSSDPSDGMLVRMDDKLSRIKNSDELRRNDVVDLLGYLVLYCTSVGWTDFSDMID